MTNIRKGKVATYLRATIYVLLLASLFVGETVVAQTNASATPEIAPEFPRASNTSTSTSIRDSINTRQEIREQVRAERQMTLSLERQTRIINLAANVSNRMDAAVARLYTIVARLESRITKMEQAGTNVTTAKAELQNSTQILATAKSLLANIDSVVYEATTANTPFSAWQTVRAEYEKIAELIRNSRTSLRTTVILLMNPNSAANGDFSTTTPVSVVDETPVLQVD